MRQDHKMEEKQILKGKKMNVVWSTMSWSDPTRLKDKIDNNIEIGALQPQMQEIITEITQNLC